MARILENPKDLILFTAKQLVEREGIAALSMRKLATECDIALGTIYNYYPTKMELIINIIEDFWIGCFSDFDLRDSSDMGFFEYLKQLYFHILGYLESFRNNWLSDLLSLPKLSKAKGKIKETEYTNKLLVMISMLFEKHKDEFERETFENLDKQMLCDFVFVNFMAMLKKYEHNYDFFDLILKKVLLK